MRAGALPPRRRQARAPLTVRFELKPSSSAAPRARRVLRLRLTGHVPQDLGRAPPRLRADVPRARARRVARRLLPGRPLGRLRRPRRRRQGARRRAACAMPPGSTRVLCADSSSHHPSVARSCGTWQPAKCWSSSRRTARASPPWSASAARVALPCVAAPYLPGCLAASIRTSSCWPPPPRTAPRASGTWRPGRSSPRVRACDWPGVLPLPHAR